MELDNEVPQGNPITPAALVSPAAITVTIFALFLAMCQLEGRSIGSDYLFETLVLPTAALLAAWMGRISNSLNYLFSNTSSRIRIAPLAISLIVLALVANASDSSTFDNMFITTFLLVGLVTGLLSESRRFEESNIFLSVIVGLHLSTSFAAGIGIVDVTSIPEIGLTDEFSESISNDDFLDAQRMAIGSAFFTFWLASIALGALVVISLRGTFQDVGTGRLFSAIPTPSQSKDPLAYGSVIFLAYLIPLLWFCKISDLSAFIDIEPLPYGDGIADGSHLGVIWATFTALAVLMHAYFRAEGWHVLGAFLAANWLLFSIGHIHEMGNELPGILGDSGIIGSLSWFFIWFWLNFFVVMFASRGFFGDIAPQREQSEFRIWWKDNSYGILLSLAFVTALVVRTAWNVIPAMSASGTGLWDLSGGSDPWYMKRIVDYVIAERSHLIFDHDRAYPIGGVNPRPPLFSWSLALGGLGISWLLEIPVDEAVWWSVAGLPAIYGALIVFPIAGIATKAHSRTAGIISAWLIALMPGHMSKSTFAMSDHDSFALLFLAVAFYYWIKALNGLEHKKVFESPSSNPLYVLAGMRETWRNNPTAMANATMSGVAFTIMALGWKGFVYGPGILFLAYSVQVAINIFRGRDSLEFTSLSLQMMLTSILLPIPFYAFPGMNLLFAPSGMQPMFYIIGFTFAVGWVASSFRDKPWLLVILSGTALFGTILGALYLLQAADIYNGWDILFTGGFYFSKNKVFSTIAEAQAIQNRGYLFASYGPVVTLIAIGCAFVLLWRGSRQNKSGLTLLGLWAIIATYMAWSAGRFLSNASPAMAVLGGIGISMLWGSADFSGFKKVWRNSGIGTPRTRFRSVWSASKARPAVPAVLIVLLLITSQHTTYGIDSGIPRGDDSAYKIDNDIYNIAPDIFREDFFNLFSIMNSREYNPDASGMWYMGTFGSSYNGQGWNEAYDWLSQQDQDTPFSQRPAFVSWWDYGFQALASGQHPTVADNFQSGIPNSGGMLLSAGQADTLAMFITTLAQGDKRLNGGEVSDDFLSVLNLHMTAEQVTEFDQIMKNNDRDFVLQRSMAVVAIYDETELLRGSILSSDGIPIEGNWIVMDDGSQVGEATSNESEAMTLFNMTRGSTTEFEIVDPAHYDIGGYRYTKDLIEDYYDVSTALHRNNARLGLMRAFLITAFEMETLVDIYDGITSLPYEVSDYDSPTGSTTTRNHEIRYFAVDNKLFPLGGSYYADSSYHQGQTTGIFHAPTGLSGLDLGNYISSVYQTQRGTDGPILPRTQEQYEQEYLDDIVRQSSGASDSTEVIRMVDIDYQHQPEFFETMVARIYVGYGSSTLGLPDDAATPSIWYYPTAAYLKGSPGSYVEKAFALPGAMMNHFVIANWYDGSECELIEITGTATSTKDNDTLTNVGLSSWAQVATGQSLTEVDGIIPAGAIISEFDKENQTITMSTTAESSEGVTDLTLTGAKIDSYCGTIIDSNRAVKVVKYYSGATIEGTVELDGIGPVPNARILIERDAFSGDEVADANGTVVDRDDRTYWIPIGSTQADEQGRYSFTVPAGKIRVSAFTGEPDLDAARAEMIMGNWGNSLYDNPMYELFTEHNEDRKINPVSGILGNVYGSTWLSETIVNVSGDAGHSNGESLINAPISVQPSAASGVLTWSGELKFDGEPVRGASVILTPSSEEVTIQPYIAPTSNGTMVGQSMFFSGIGEVTFTGNGSVETTGGATTVTDFTGTHTQRIFNNHSVTGEGEFSGNGELDGLITDTIETISCSENEIPQGESLCILANGNYLISGTVNASGRFTSEGESQFTRNLVQATFVGSGTFVANTSLNLPTYGTINGTGHFSGAGIFSGPMVSPGSFHIVDALPGMYDISVEFGNGTTIDLQTIFYVATNQLQDKVPISISGGGIVGTVTDHSGEPLSSPIRLFGANETSENATMECEVQTITPPCFVSPDETGALEIGPIIPGTYNVEIDIDDDGFPEISQTYVFTPEEDTVAALPSVIPQMQDITFTLMDGESTVPDLVVILRPENESLSPVEAIFDLDSDSYRAEISQGVWILNHTLGEDKQLWRHIEVGNEDISDTFHFSVSEIVNGSVYFSPDSKQETGAPGQVMSYQEVVFQWSGFTLSTVTDKDGNFSVMLPIGSVVDATTEVMIGIDGFYSNGTRFTVEQGMDAVSLVVVESVRVSGSVSLSREGNRYTDTLSGWEPISVVATSVNGSTSASWRKSADSQGTFEMVIPNGNWVFVLDPGNMGTSSTVIEEVNSSTNVELLFYPEANATVMIDLFIDHDGDNNASNGTLVTYPFEVIPLGLNGEGYSVAADGDEWYSTGRAEITLEPGSYRIIIERANASADEPFDTLYDVNDVFQVGMDASIVEQSVGFEPLWLVNITFTNERDELLIEHEVEFQNADNGWIQTFSTDENGRVVDYIPEGDWIVIVDEFETVYEVVEGLRELITVSQQKSNFRYNFRTQQLADVSVFLTDSSSSGNLEQMNLRFTSQDGLGSFTVQATGFQDPVEIRITPGHWNIELNQTDAQGIRLFIENTSLIESGVTVGPNHSIHIGVQRLVELSGKVYWDLDQDGSPSFSEGIANAYVNITSHTPEIPSLSEYAQSVISDTEGSWSTFLPATSGWNISVEKYGFGTVNTSILLGQSYHEENIEITAGEVEVSGTVSYVDQSVLGHDWHIVLIPSHGIARDRVIPDKVGNEVDGWTGEWTATIEPGKWVVYVTVDDPTYGYLVDVDTLDANATGGSTDSTLSTGGKMFLDTEWMDYDGISHSLSEIEGYDLKISVGMGISWSEQLGEDGVLQLILPTGRIDSSSEFEHEQRGTNMSYTGGQGVTMISGQDSPLRTLSLERSSKQDISVSVIGGDTIMVEPEPGCEDPDCEYTKAEFTLSIEYDGHNPFDTYEVTGTVPGMDGHLWLVEFENKSESCDMLYCAVANTTSSLEMGLDNVQSIGEFSLRVTPANKSQAHSFGPGHTVLIKFSTTEGYSTQVELTVKIPKFAGFEIKEDFEDNLYFSLGQKLVEVEIPFTNLGNGDESLFFDYQVPADWELAGPQIQPVSPFSHGQTSIVLNYLGDEGEQLSNYGINLTVSDLNNNSYEYQFSLISDSPILSIDGSSIQLMGGGNPVVGGQSVYIVTVLNEAFVPAEGVTLRATLCSDINCVTPVGVNASAVDDVPANGYSLFSIPMDFSGFSTPDKYFILFEIDVGETTDINDLEACTASGAQGASFCVIEAQLWSEAEEDILGWMAYLFIIMLAVAIYFLTKRPGRRAGAPF